MVNQNKKLFKLKTSQILVHYDHKNKKVIIDELKYGETATDKLVNDSEKEADPYWHVVGSDYSVEINF